jgi:uncharacterized protein (TIGR03067 family)
MALVVAGTPLIFCFAGSGESKPTNLPAELQGVWTVVSGEDDGEKMKFARGDEWGNGYTMYNEIIIQGDRWIENDNWGCALVFRVKVVADVPVKLVRVWGDRAETKKGDPYCFTYRLKGDELTLCMAKCDRPPTTFSAAKGSGQMLLVLKRAQ